VAVGLGIYVAVGVGLSVTVAIGAAGAGPQALSAPMTMVENRKLVILCIAFLLIKSSHTHFLNELITMPCKTITHRIEELAYRS
jgi:hypothetical protein